MLEMTMIAAAFMLQSAATGACDTVSLDQLPLRELSHLGLHPAGDSHLKTFRVQRMAPPCARHLREFDGGRVALDDGRTFALVLEQEGVRAIAGAPPIGSFLAALPPGQGGPGRFLFGHRMGSWVKAGATFTENVGVWQIGSGYELRGFLVRGNAIVGRPRPILRSAWPIRSVGYSPLPDASAGSLHLALQTAPQELVLASLNWHHPGFFQPN
jgi:hypothetical protein